MIFTYIILGFAVVIFATILCVVIKIWKKKRIIEITSEENENYGRQFYEKEKNENYGNLTTVQYYEEEKKCKIVDSNDYY